MIFLPAAGIAWIAAVALVSGESDRSGNGLNEAAKFYHQGRYDSALARLEGMDSQGALQRRDSLSRLQYLGMASARLNLDDQAVGYFAGLLRLDSLFQFPRNEDPGILRAFAAARARNAAAELPEVSVEKIAAKSPAPIGSPPDSAGPVFALGLPGGTASPDYRKPGKIGFALGALPLGAGWIGRGKIKPGLAFGLLEACGIGLSLYASHMQSAETDDIYHVRNTQERNHILAWKWVQRVSLSVGVGAYLFSIFAAGGD